MAWPYLLHSHALTGVVRGVTYIIEPRHQWHNYEKSGTLILQ